MVMKYGKNQRVRCWWAMLWLALVVAAPAGAAELVLPGLDGREHRLSDYRGKWVVVNYWATWCPPCVAEMPELVFFHDNHKDRGAMVLGVNYEDAPLDKVRAFVEEHMVSYPILLASPDEGSPLGRIRGLPTTFIVSPAGKVVHRHFGMVDTDYLEQLIADFEAGRRP